MFQVTTLIPKDGTVKDIPLTDDKKNPKINYNLDFFKKPAYLTVSG
jgi:hypothetical protein